MTGLLAWAGYDGLPGDPKDWPAEKKLELVKAMGFEATGSDHQPDCPYVIDADYRCNCIPPATTFMPPRDVQQVMGDTLEHRREKAKKPRPIPAVER